MSNCSLELYPSISWSLVFWIGLPAGVRNRTEAVFGNPLTAPFGAGLKPLGARNENPFSW